MDPKSNEAPMHLPAPIEELPNSATAGAGLNSRESSPASAENAPGLSSAPMPTSIPLPTPPSMPMSSQTSSSTAISSQANPAQASDDADLIEKEWVNKAKQIVEQTKDDPYKQTEELNVFKADYMKKRYNRAVKLK